MKYGKVFIEYGMVSFVELDEPTNACSPQIVYPKHSFYHGEWNSTYETKQQIDGVHGRIIHFNRDSTYDDFEDELFDLIVGKRELFDFQSSVMKNRLRAYNMFYSQHEYVKIKNIVQLVDSGMDDMEAQMLASIAGKIFKISSVCIKDETYSLDGSEIEVCDADIYTLVYPEE